MAKKDESFAPTFKIEDVGEWPVILEYADPKPTSNQGRVRRELVRLYEEHHIDGTLPTSSRFLFYELVARKIIAKDAGQRPDQIVIKALTQLREWGVIPWEAIVDETREVSNFTGSATVAGDLLLYLGAARLDPWDGKPPLILTESRSLAGALRDLAREYRINIAATNGRTNGFLRTKLARAVTADTRIGYLGDFDFAGGHIEDNTRRVLASVTGGTDWERLALTEDQVRDYALPIIRKKDGRDGIERDAVETEALGQAVITQVVRDWLDGMLRAPIESYVEREREERERLRELIEGEE